MLRTAPSIESKRAAKIERENAKATAKIEREKTRENEREARRIAASAAALEEPNRPREAGIDYVIQINDATAGDGTRTIATFGREDFRDAFANYLRTLKTEPSARLLKVYERGWIMSPILGFVRTRPLRKPSAHARLEKGKFVIGWNRIEPMYRGTNHWSIEPHEREAMFPNRIVIRTSVRPLRNSRRIRPTDLRFT